MCKDDHRRLEYRLAPQDDICGSAAWPTSIQSAGLSIRMPRLMGGTFTTPGRAAAKLPGPVTDNVTVGEISSQCVIRWWEN